VKFLSVCSGIEAASCAWKPLGWQAVAFAEIEPFPSAVLAHHYPDTPNWGDMTNFKDWPDVSIDLLCGGTPCQSFSVAGLRKGLDDPRGNLMLTYGAIAAKYRPKWLVWENVPGVLSSNGGRDFGSFLGLLGQLGYGFAYRVLDAQYFGLAQRRRRVFVVGCFGDWRSAAAVLFERHSLQGHPAPRRETGKAAPAIAGAGVASGGIGADCWNGALTGEISSSVTAGGVTDAFNPAVLAQDPAHTLGSCPGAYRSYGEGQFNYVLDGSGNGQGAREIGKTMLGGGHSPNPLDETLVVHSLRGEGFDASEDGTGRGTPLVPTYTLAIRGRGDSHDLEYRTDGTANALLTPNGGRGGIGVGAIAFDCKASGQNGFGIGEIASTQRAMGHAGSHTNGGGHQAVMAGMQVRRLTPRECERLQGFPDDYTLIPHRGKPAADGPRYKALGNSWAVPCARWIGERIHAVEQINAPRKAP